MTDAVITSAGVAGVIGALLWLGVLPYLQARKEAETNGTPVPSFAKEYLTSMVLSSLGGFISVFVVINELEHALATAGSIISAASIGFAYTFTILGITNNIIDLKAEKTQLKKEVKTLKGEPPTTTPTTPQPPK